MIFQSCFMRVNVLNLFDFVCDYSRNQISYRIMETLIGAAFRGIYNHGKNIWHIIHQQLSFCTPQVMLNPSALRKTNRLWPQLQRSVLYLRLFEYMERSGSGWLIWVNMKRLRIKGFSLIVKIGESNFLFDLIFQYLHDLDMSATISCP